MYLTTVVPSAGCGCGVHEIPVLGTERVWQHVTMVIRRLVWGGKGEGVGVNCLMLVWSKYRCSPEGGCVLKSQLPLRTGYAHAMHCVPHAPQ